MYHCGPPEQEYSQPVPPPRDTDAAITIMAFHLFPDLPTELRLTIWEMALYDEVQVRVVPLEENHVIPFKYMRSPFLETNKECRDLALKQFYTLKLPVYRFRAQTDSILADFFAIDPSTPSNYTTTQQGEAGWGVPDCWSVTYNDCLLFHNYSVERGTSHEGYVYLSPKYEKFMISGSYGFEPFRSERYAPYRPSHAIWDDDDDRRNENDWEPQNTFLEPDRLRGVDDGSAFNHVSDELSWEALQSVRNLVVVEGVPHYKYDHGMEWDDGDNGVAERGFDDYLFDKDGWECWRFPGVQGYWHLWLMGDVRGTEQEKIFLPDLSRMNLTDLRNRRDRFKLSMNPSVIECGTSTRSCECCWDIRALALEPSSHDDETLILVDVERRMEWLTGCLPKLPPGFIPFLWRYE
ncbi:hypothetical protein F5Y16DRAFT_421619 [Xylariaceae sp. FL0255]|nr:hypothetical protein F5Y16DRAFT_421619 [Xylariaceae sp. FL0255]